MKKFYRKEFSNKQETKKKNNFDEYFLFSRKKCTHNDKKTRRGSSQYQSNKTEYRQGNFNLNFKIFIQLLPILLIIVCFIISYFFRNVKYIFISLEYFISI